jgi:hypothetical protein
METKTPEQRMIVHISNKIDELHIEVERLQELVKGLCGQKVPAKVARDAAA